MDVCKIGPKLYQFTAIDDCTRLKIIRLYPNKASASTLAFLEEIITELPCFLFCSSERTITYNRERRHSSIGKSLWQKWQELIPSIPTPEQIRSIY